MESHIRSVAKKPFFTVADQTQIAGFSEITSLNTYIGIFIQYFIKTH